MTWRSARAALAITSLLFGASFAGEREARAERTSLSLAPAEQRRGDDRSPALNAIFFEALGSGLLYSVSYERRLPWHDLGVRAGGSFFTYATSAYGGSGNLTLVSIPLLATWAPALSSKYPAHRANVGAGATVLWLDPPTDSRGTSYGGDRAGLGVAASAVLGYRYLPPSGGFTFALAFTPLLRASGLLPWGGVSAGIAF